MLENKEILSLMTSYGYKLGVAKDLSKQPELSESEKLYVLKKLAQCELLAEIVSKNTGNYSIAYDYNAAEKEILKRMEVAV